MREFHFKVYNPELIDYLDSKSNVSEFLRDIADDVRTGKLTKPTTEINIDTRIKNLRAADLTLKVWDRLKQAGYTLDQLKFFVSGGELGLPQNKTFYAEKETAPILSRTFGQTVNYKPDKIKQDDGTLRCKHCNKRIDMRAFDHEQLDDYRIHAENVHGGLDEDERAELMEIYPN